MVLEVEEVKQQREKRRRFFRPMGRQADQKSTLAAMSLSRCVVMKGVQRNLQLRCASTVRKGFVSR